jgi:large subunit ribosomal protein L21
MAGAAHGAPGLVLDRFPVSNHVYLQQVNAALRPHAQALTQKPPQYIDPHPWRASARIFSFEFKVPAMFAVIKTGGKQYRVAKDDVLAIEKVEGDAGATVVFDHVLIMGGDVGKPRLAGAQVTGTVVRQFRDDTVIIFKKRRRKHYRRRNGHRQHLTLVKITGMGKA